MQNFIWNANFVRYNACGVEMEFEFASRYAHSQWIPSEKIGRKFYVNCIRKSKCFCSIRCYFNCKCTVTSCRRVYNEYTPLSTMDWWNCLDVCLSLCVSVQMFTITLLFCVCEIFSGLPHAADNFNRKTSQKITASLQLELCTVFSTFFLIFFAIFFSPRRGC